MANHLEMLQTVRAAYDLFAVDSNHQPLLEAFAATLKVEVPAITAIRFDWVDGPWIWVDAPTEDIETSIENETIENCLPDADSEFGFFLMGLIGGAEFGYELEVRFDAKA